MRSIPTNIGFTARGGKYNMGAFFGYIQDMAANSVGGDEPGLAEMEQFTAALKDIGLDVVAYDMEMSAVWNPNDGATTSHLSVSAEELGDWRQAFDGELPDFEEVKTLLPGGRPAKNSGDISASQGVTRAGG